MTTDPELQAERSKVEQKVLIARTRLEYKIQELGRRVESTKQALDLAKLVREHPGAAAGIAVAAGAVMGLMLGGPKSRLGGMISTLVTGAAMQVARNVVSARLSEVLDDRTP